MFSIATGGQESGLMVTKLFLKVIITGALIRPKNLATYKIISLVQQINYIP